MKHLFYIPLLIFMCSCSGDHEDSLSDNQVDFCDQIHRNDSISLSQELKPFDAQMKNQTGVYVLEKGENALLARAFLSEHAEKSIDIQYFIFSTDNVGLIACDYLVRAADRGVKVRMLIDDLLVDASIHDVLSLDAHENITIKIYNPALNFGKNVFDKITTTVFDFQSVNHRMHNKTFIVDEKVVITGGRNIADEYFDYDHEYNFRDRDVMLIGKATKDVSASFEDFWNSNLSVPVTDLVEAEDLPNEDPNRYDLLHQYACNPENYWPEIRKKAEHMMDAFKSIQESGDFVWVDDVTFVSDEPGKNVEGKIGAGNTTIELTKLVMNAKHSVDIQTPYLITMNNGIELFKKAIEHGVKIRILTNSLASTDNLEAFSGYQAIRADLLKAGVEIYEQKPDAKVRMELMETALQDSLAYRPIFGLHAKSMVIDNEITVVGTFNLDPRSAYINSECIAVVCSKKIAASVTKEMNIEFLPENAWKISLDWNPDHHGGAEKILESIKRHPIPNGIL